MRSASVMVLEEYMPKMDRDEMKSIMKEAIKEWMDERYADFGRWSFFGIAAGALGWLAFAIMTAQGWHK